MSAEREAKGEVLQSWATAFNVPMDNFIAAVAVQSIERFTLSQVRRAAARMIASTERMPYGVSPVGLLVDECQRQLEADRYAADCIPPERQIGKAAPEPPISLKELMAKNPDFKLPEFLKPKRERLTEDEMAEKKRAQLRALQMTEKERRQA